jgi:hypothetical protein
VGIGSIPADVWLEWQRDEVHACAVLFVIMTNIVSAETAPTAASFDIKAAERFANLALACVHKEYPNKISHTLNSDADVAAPRKLTPAFYGCYDWHSSVHGYWLLVRLVRTFPNANFVQPAREALRQSLSPENIAQEATYLRGQGRASFERPYGLAWLLQLWRNSRSGTILKQEKWLATSVLWNKLRWNV